MQGLNLFASAASPGSEAGYEQLRAAILGAIDEPEPAGAAPRIEVDPRRIAEMARLEALRGEDLFGLQLFGIAAELGGIDILDRELANLYAQLASRLGSVGPTRPQPRESDLSPACLWGIKLDAANPWTAGGPKERWLELLNHFPGCDARREPISVIDSPTAAPPFDRLSARASNSVEGPKVSVIMTAYRPGGTMLTAVQSVLSQSWANLELLIVDDASPGIDLGPLREVEALDDRIRVIRRDLNRGAYCARNLALSLSDAEYVTFQDWDDWSHPRRIELQVEPLLGADDLLATRSRAVRAFSDLTVTYPGYPPDRINASSLLFRRRDVVDRVCEFDAVRKSGDTEFLSRLEATSPGAVLDLPERAPLALTQLRPDSLSRTDVAPGWLSWARAAYANAYQHRHRQIAPGSFAPPWRSTGERAVPLPDPSWSPSAAGRSSRQHYDLVLVNDWRPDLGSHRLALDELLHLRSEWRDVAIAQLETPLPPAPKRQPLTEPIQQLISDGELELIHLTQDVSASLIVVQNPATMQYLPGSYGGLRGDTVAILCDNAASNLFDPQVCSDNVAELFGVDPFWIARHEGARTALLRSVGGDAVASSVAPPARDLGQFRANVKRPSSVRPVIGRHFGPTRESWPATLEILLATHPASEAFDVRLMGDLHCIAGLLPKQDIPPNWICFDRDELPVRGFLSQLDFYVCFPHEYTEIRWPTAAFEALASGCVAVMDHRFEPFLGAAAIYAAPEEVQSMVLDLHARPDEFLAQQRRGFSLIAETGNPALLLSALRGGQKRAR